MKKLVLLLIIAACACQVRAARPADGPAPVNVSATESYSRTLYERLKLSNVVGLAAFSHAIAGREKIADAADKDILVVIDFSKPSTAERMCVIDLGREKVLYRTHVAHGRNSGGNYATSFSNKPGSYQSSLGFYVTEGTYTGRNGYSLVLHGLEKGINDKAKERAIVMHGASYCDASFIPSAGRLGRSHGCPALPTAVSKEIIDTIKGGALLFIYADDASYRKQSLIIE